MGDVADGLLTGLLNHGELLLGGTLFLAALGVPLPATMLLVAAGAFTRSGVLALETAIVAAFASSVAGDLGGYTLGRLGIGLVPAAWLQAPGWQRATALFARWGGWSVFLTRFAITPAAWSVNLLAGSTRYSLLRFALAACAGEAVWILLFGGLGRLFAEQWEQVGEIAADVGGLIVGVAMLAAGGWLLRASRR
ncbi:VTT domain-containing protein [Ramlibacter sp. AW1]|uniref:VTT domain-containing protein n=1 Tax=Ramlibacter aurantiacus TaxID=2801330 RepID=A0A936ZMP3_9BURK|nr:VTT domain-containing protein [Ramlibacter aurantiacus]MBL0419021.1 VTT domain-containing protein [Ramlibacter aurantiacus]